MTRQKPQKSFQRHAGESLRINPVRQREAAVSRSPGEEAVTCEAPCRKCANVAHTSEMGRTEQQKKRVVGQRVAPCESGNDGLSPGSARQPVPGQKRGQPRFPPAGSPRTSWLPAAISPRPKSAGRPASGRAAGGNLNVRDHTAFGRAPKTAPLSLRQDSEGQKITQRNHPLAHASTAAALQEPPPGTGGNARGFACHGFVVTWFCASSCSPRPRCLLHPDAVLRDPLRRR